MYARSAGLLKASMSGAPLIVISDIDRTLTRYDQQDEYNINFLDGVIETIKSLKAVDTLFVASSARSLAEIKDAFAECPCDAIIANDGYVIAIGDKYEPIYYGDTIPDYSEFIPKVSGFIEGMEGVRIKNMEAYCTLFVDLNHPMRNVCEEFFKAEVEAVSTKSGGIDIEFQTWASTISLGPRDKRGKAGAVEFLLPKLLDKFGFENTDKLVYPVIVCAGDGHNDVEALQWVKDRGGFSFFVRDGVARGCPTFATAELLNAAEWVMVLQMLERDRKWFLDKMKNEVP
jgi:HAD superfamily hydrolase (TIGR01484 family)